MNKLNRCFNACIRYVFGLRKYDHLSLFRYRLIGCSLDTLFEFKASWFIGQLLRSKSPLYLFDKLSLSPNFSNNLRLLLRHNNSLCSNSSLFVRGLRSWNQLSLPLKKIKSRAVFLDRFLELRRSNIFTTWADLVGHA